jgi:hypothetical protein
MEEKRSKEKIYRVDNATPHLPHYIIWTIKGRLNKNIEWGSVVDGKGAGEPKELQGGRT